MSLQLDHIVIAVDDLAQAIEDYRNLGFNVRQGGRHSAGTTENALISLQDDAYIELIAPTGEAPSGEGTDFRILLKDEPGFTGFALLADDLDAQADRLRGQQVPVGAVQTGRRTRTDGETLAWKLAFIEETVSPFYIQDVTARALRTGDPQQAEHGNGVRGVFDVMLLVADVLQAIPLYSTYFGQMPQMIDSNAVFILANTTLTLTAPRTDEQRAYYAQRGSVPYKLTLLTGDPQIETANVHGAKIDFVERAVPLDGSLPPEGTTMA